ncbi:hypothetical protein H0G86_001705 [Trichoderma simmonsii]|uniref:Uncharacterized protein n=1 Tax=Trichoderma simmonsii TaxID=1491479 RepID=A0A8G0L7A4_9HYPO|nr:hypothetical protein H0G86_001705 [Trichoderma simmonsii]
MRPDRVGLEVEPRFWLNGGKGPTRTGGMEGKPAGTRKYLVCWVYLDLDHVPPHHVFSPRGSRLTIQCLTAELDNNTATIFFVISISASFRAMKTPLPDAGQSPLLVASLEVGRFPFTGAVVHVLYVHALVDTGTYI